LIDAEHFEPLVIHILEAKREIAIQITELDCLGLQVIEVHFSIEFVPRCFSNLFDGFNLDFATQPGHRYLFHFFKYLLFSDGFEACHVGFVHGELVEAYQSKERSGYSTYKDGTYGRKVAEETLCKVVSVAHSRHRHEAKPDGIVEGRNIEQFILQQKHAQDARRRTKEEQHRVDRVGIVEEADQRLEINVESENVGDSVLAH
jgi:hypothetical protein